MSGDTIAGSEQQLRYTVHPSFGLQSPFHPSETPMFQQLVPLLRQRSVLLTVTSLEDDQIRVNVLPKKLSDGENAALTTPMSFTGTAAELDAQLPDAIVSFVASHLELKNTLGRAKEEMAAAAKVAQEIGRA